MAGQGGVSANLWLLQTRGCPPRLAGEPLGLSRRPSRAESRVVSSRSDTTAQSRTHAYKEPQQAGIGTVSGGDRDAPFLKSTRMTQRHPSPLLLLLPTSSKLHACTCPLSLYTAICDTSHGIRWLSRPQGTHTGPLHFPPPNTIAPTNRQVQWPVQAQSMLFDEQGRCYQLTVGYSCDRQVLVLCLFRLFRRHHRRRSRHPPAFALNVHMPS